MQYRFPVEVGPSSNTCPRWLLHFLQTASVRIVSWLLSSRNSTVPFLAESKLGHPVPESNLASLPNSSAPHAAHMYVPFSLLWSSLPLKARSVPFLRSTSYCSGVSFCLNSSSLHFMA